MGDRETLPLPKGAVLGVFVKRGALQAAYVAGGVRCRRRTLQAGRVAGGARASGEHGAMQCFGAATPSSPGDLVGGLGAIFGGDGAKEAENDLPAGWLVGSIRIAVRRRAPRERILRSAAASGRWSSRSGRALRVCGRPWVSARRVCRAARPVGVTSSGAG